MNKIALTSKEKGEPSQKQPKIKTVNSLPDKSTQKTKENEPTNSKICIDKKEGNPHIQEKQIAAELLNIQCQLKCNEIINLAHGEEIKDTPSSYSAPSCSVDETAVNPEGQWNEVTYRRKPFHHKRRMIIGNNKDSAIKGVRKLVHLHVSRIDLNTSIIDLKNLLKNSFPEVSCESITPKYPNIYSSFKVTIFEDNFRKAMDPKVWPDGACISRFFQKRKTTNPVVK